MVTAWHHAIRHAYGAARVVKEPTKYGAYSTTRPDIVHEGAGPTRLKHVLYETKVVSPISTSAAGSSPRGATIAFANTADRLKAEILGAHATPRHAAVVGAYAMSQRLGHDVRDLIHETFGGFAPGSVALLMRLSRARANGLGASAASAPWFANQSFKSYHSIRISIAIHAASASEILTNAELDQACELSY